MHIDPSTFRFFKIVRAACLTVLVLSGTLPVWTMLMLPESSTADERKLIGVSLAVVVIIMLIMAFLVRTVSDWHAKSIAIRDVIDDLFAALNRVVVGNESFTFPGIKGVEVTVRRDTRSDTGVPFIVEITDGGTLQHNWEVSRTRIAPVENPRQPLPAEYLGYVEDILEQLESQLSAADRVKDETARRASHADGRASSEV